MGKLFTQIRKLLPSVLLIVLIYIYMDLFLDDIIGIYTKYTACTSPITYSLGTFSTQFGISRKDFLQDVQKAESIWEKELGKPLFVYRATDGDLTVNLVYDYRQEATTKLRAVGSVITTGESSYDTLKNEYTRLKALYEKEGTTLNARVNSFTVRQKVYNEEVARWNAQGGAPPADYDRLNKEASYLDKENAELKILEGALEKDRVAINTTASKLNSLADSLNLNVSKYNKIGESRGSEFEEGLYVKNLEEQKIDVYEFKSQDDLVRLLAHELGHALGMQHVDDENAIMYRLNHAKTLVATQDDVAELKRVCQLETTK